jgi:hypothetical protein
MTIIMKKIYFLAVVFLIVSIQKSIAQKTDLKGLPQGAVAAATNGFTMTAKINGKAVKATAMMPPEKAEEIVGFYDGDKYIGLPYNKKDMVAGKKISFSDQNADLTTNNPTEVWNGSKGEMEITKVTAQWIEGKFSFTGYTWNNKKSIQVTEGFFRIPLK